MARGLTLTLTRLSRAAPLCLLTAEHFPFLGECCPLSGSPAHLHAYECLFSAVELLPFSGNRHPEGSAWLQGSAGLQLHRLCPQLYSSRLPSWNMSLWTCESHPEPHSCRNWLRGWPCLQPSDDMGRRSGVGRTCAWSLRPDEGLRGASGAARSRAEKACVSLKGRVLRRVGGDGESVEEGLRGQSQEERLRGSSEGLGQAEGGLGGGLAAGTFVEVRVWPGNPRGDRWQRHAPGRGAAGL